jgi:hypothetical protein
MNQPERDTKRIPADRSPQGGAAEGSERPRAKSDPSATEAGRRRRGKQPSVDRATRLYSFPDQVERAVCKQFEVRLPSSFPVQSRSDIATAAMTVVAERDGALLLCNGLHAGNHQWPDDVEVTQTEASDIVT